MNDRSLDDPLPGEPFGATPLLKAVYDNDRARVIELLDAGADINRGSHWWAGSFHAVDHRGPLLPLLLERGATLTAYAAAKHGMLKELKEIVARDPAAVHRRGGDGQTPLHVADSVEIAAFLLDHGADIEAIDVDHESTPAQYLIGDRPEVVRYLISRGAKTDIMLAAALGDANMVRRHLDADPEAILVSVTDRWFPMKNPRAGGTIYNWSLDRYASPHLIAKRRGHTEVLALLMERSPATLQLSLACEFGDDALIARLRGADPDLAARLAQEDRIKLVQQGQHNNTAAVTRMLAAGWPVDTQDSGGVGVLHWAGFHGNIAMVREVLKYGPPLDLKDKEFGGTPLSWASYGSEHSWCRATGDYPAVLAALKEAGARMP